MKKKLRNALTAIFLVFVVSAQADDDKVRKDLTIGMLPYVSASRLVKIFLPLKNYLESNTSYTIVLLTAPTFKKFLQRTQSRAYDLVFTAPHFALLAEREQNYHRLVRFNKNLTACVFVRADSKINFIKELKGAVISTPGSLAMVSLMGESMLIKAGLDLSGGIELIRTPSHNNAIISVTNKGADAGIVAISVYEYYTSRAVIKKPIKLLSCSDPVPGPMFMANDTISSTEREMLISLLLKFPESEYGKKFLKATPLQGVKRIDDIEMQALDKYVEELRARL